MYVTILLVVHVLGAIAGLGPTFAFAVLGKNAGKAEPAGAIALMDTILDIEKKIVTPVALFTQPLTGVLLIFATNRNEGFFRREWLVIAIIVYIGILVISYMIDQPAIHRVVKGMREGAAGTPAWNKDLRKAQVLGPLMGIMLVVIVILMVWKPGE